MILILNLCSCISIFSQHCTVITMEEDIPDLLSDSDSENTTEPTDIGTFASRYNLPTRITNEILNANLMDLEVVNQVFVIYVVLMAFEIYTNIE